MRSTFSGFERPHGRVGTRNHLLVLPTSPSANRIVELVAEHGPPAAYITTMPSLGGRGDAARALTRLCTNPNVGAAVLVGLGDPEDPAEDVAEACRAAGVPAEVLDLRRAGGRPSLLAAVHGRCSELSERLSQEGRRPVPVSGLVLGTECGGSDAYSGLTANPVLGRASDRLVADGGTVLLCELPELIGAEHLLASRAVDDDVAHRALAAVRRWEDTVIGFGEDLRGAQPSPGNQAGGLTTVEEKSLGGMAKGGTTPLVDVVGFGEPPARKGLVLMDTPGNDIEQLTGMALGGANVVVFTTGRGTPTASPIVPTLKISTNSAMARRLESHIDLDAGPVASGEATIDGLGDELYELVLAVAEGRLTAGERTGHRDFALPPLARWS